LSIVLQRQVEKSVWAGDVLGSLSDVYSFSCLSLFAFLMQQDPKSVGESATMAFFLKPLTYNSQVVGYLTRSYPSDWTTIDAISKQVLKTYTDAEILVRETNTPDLRESGKLVQKSVDERAIKARK
jgi:hypothetical protein